MSAVGAINLLHPRPPQSLNGSCVCVFITLHITAQSDPVIYSFYATACNPPGVCFSWTYCWPEIRVDSATTPLSLSLSLSLSLCPLSVSVHVYVHVCVCLFIKVVFSFILGVRLHLSV